jgi:hypothetical protein
MQKRAVLIAGGVSRRWCYPRYAHELAWWARALVARGWECVICHGDGSQHRAFMGIAAHVVFGTQAHVTTALKWAGEAGERAMVVCANHGAPEGLSLWGSEVLTPAGLVEALGAGEAQRGEMDKLAGEGMRRNAAEEAAALAPAGGAQQLLGGAGGAGSGAAPMAVDGAAGAAGWASPFRDVPSHSLPTLTALLPAYMEALLRSTEAVVL